MEISQPMPGEAVSGVVIIEGTADHPDFVFYELSFSYNPNPSETWFPLVEPIMANVLRGRLAIWDTTSITDGNYNLRLSVRLEDGTDVSTVVENIRIRNHLPVETDTPAPRAPTLVPSPVPPSLTPSPTALVRVRDPEPGQVTRAFFLGTSFSIAGLGLFGAYAVVRRRIRARIGSLRMRHLYWKRRRKQRWSRRS